MSIVLCRSACDCGIDKEHVIPEHILRFRNAPRAPSCGLLPSFFSRQKIVKSTQHLAESWEHHCIVELVLAVEDPVLGLQAPERALHQPTQLGALTNMVLLPDITRNTILCM
jgi:hypothetical protein